MMRKWSDMIEIFWGNLFCINGDATHDRKSVDGGMRNGAGYICEK